MTPYCPFATQRLLHGEEDTRPPMTPRAVTMHGHGSKGTAANVGDYFDREDVHVESHFDVAKDGNILQFLRVDRQAHHAYAANAYSVGVETEDDGNTAGAWTPQQVTSIARLLSWLCQEWHIPLKRFDGTRGVAGHCQVAAWNRDGHVDPGPKRLAQLATLLIATANPPEDDDLPLTDDQIATLAGRIGAYVAPERQVWAWYRKFKPGVNPTTNDLTYWADRLALGENPLALLGEFKAAP